MVLPQRGKVNLRGGESRAGRRVSNATPQLVNVEPRLRADDGVRTRDPQLGKLMLYQLSYVRVLVL